MAAGGVFRGARPGRGPRWLAMVHRFETERLLRTGGR